MLESDRRDIPELNEADTDFQPPSQCRRGHIFWAVFQGGAQHLSFNFNCPQNVYGCVPLCAPLLVLSELPFYAESVFAIDINNFRSPNSIWTIKNGLRIDGGLRMFNSEQRSSGKEVRGLQRFGESFCGRN